MKLLKQTPKHVGKLALIAISLVFAGGAFAVDDVNLRTLAVTNSDGSLKVLYHGSNAWWNALGEYAPFDGDLSTMIDPKKINYTTWVGYELTEPRVVTRIRFAAPSRTDNQDRLRSCRVEGANEPDFSDAVILLDVRNVVPEQWMTGTPYWFEATAQQMATPKAFKYLRFVQWKKASNTSTTTEGNSFVGNIAELEFYGVELESYASYVVPPVTQESNLRQYAMHDDTGALDIISDKYTPYGTGYEYYKAFDYTTSTFYDPKNNTSTGHWVGYELFRPMCITRIRYCGRRDGRDSELRLRYCRIEGANQADFSDAVTLHGCAKAVPDDWNSHPGWIEVLPEATAGTNTFRYLRLFEPAGNKQCGDVSELEFYGMEPEALVAQVLANPQPPTDIAASHGVWPEAANVLWWQLQPGVSDTTILRAFGLGGPWTELAHVSATNGWADTTAPASSVCYYKVIANFSSNGEGFSVTNETPVSIRRWRLLERDPSNMTTMRTGVNIIYKCGTKFWTGSTIEESVGKAFDNLLFGQAASNFADTQSTTPRTCIGVDLGAQAYCTYMRFFSGISEGNSSRLNGVVLSGSNVSDWNLDGNFTTITEPLVWAGQTRWYEEPSLDVENTYRYLFCHNPDYNGWNNNASELQFYGWFVSDLAGVAMEVSDLAVSYGATPLVTLTWTPNNAYGTYTIERKVAGGEWEAVASGLAASTTTWTDTNVTAGTRYTYRVKTVNGANEAYPPECEAVPYVVGSGVGLHGVWSRPYSTMDVGEAVVSVETNAVISFENATVGGGTENFFVRWTGKLIVPIAGDYTFDAEVDDTVALWIDGAPVLYRGAADGAVTLTAGEHDIVATWFQGDGENFCRLYWGGPVARAVIPSTQLVPVVPTALPEEWEGARTFSNAADICYPGDVKFNANGTIDLAFGGADLYFAENGYFFLWRQMKGDFVCVARVESIRGETAANGQKGGLMVRAALDSASPFEACVLKWEGSLSNRKLYLGNKRCTARGASPTDGRDIITGQGAWKHPVTGNAGWIKLTREGNVFTYSYRSDGETAWTAIYRLVDEAGAYGETVYVGLASATVDNVLGRVPNFDWRFSNLILHPTIGTKIFLR